MNFRIRSWSSSRNSRHHTHKFHLHCIIIVIVIFLTLHVIFMLSSASWMLSAPPSFYHHHHHHHHHHSYTICKSKAKGQVSWQLLPEKKSPNLILMCIIISITIMVITFNILLILVACFDQSNEGTWIDQKKFREHQRAILEAYDIWDSWSERWESIFH